MDADGNGAIDIEEWMTCMTPELKRAIYRSLANPDKLNGFQPLVDVAKVKIHFDLIKKLKKYSTSSSFIFQSNLSSI